MNANELMTQIGNGNLMAVGARDFMLDGNSLQFRVGAGRKLNKLIVTLEPTDTYSVRYVEMTRSPKFKIVKDETETDVYAESIGAVVRRMGDR